VNVLPRGGERPSNEVVKEVHTNSREITLERTLHVGEGERKADSLHLEQDLIPWMENAWRRFQGKGFEKPKYDPSDLCDRVGQEKFRGLWLENCQQPSASKTKWWLSEINKQFPRNGNGNARSKSPPRSGVPLSDPDLEFWRSGKRPE
jgi:hypothetical protein